MDRGKIIYTVDLRTKDKADYSGIYNFKCIHCGAKIRIIHDIGVNGNCGSMVCENCDTKYEVTDDDCLYSTLHVYDCEGNRHYTDIQMSETLNLHSAKKKCDDASGNTPKKCVI